MTYQQLLESLLSLNPDQLACAVTIEVGSIAECFPVNLCLLYLWYEMSKLGIPIFMVT